MMDRLRLGYRLMVEPQPFDPAIYEGTNATLASAISADGTPEYHQHYQIMPRTGCAVRLKTNDLLTIENPSGHQVCDFWCFSDPNVDEYLSMAHTHTTLMSIFPRVGDVLVSVARQEMLKFEKDTSPGIHDTVIAACDAARYRELGVDTYHDNCADNLRMALEAIGLRAPTIPAPFNLWMNIPVTEDGKTQWQAPVSKARDQVVFRALCDCIAVMSACPQDITPVNGVGVEPDKLAFSISSD